jgi:hypothetical protein
MSIGSVMVDIPFSKTKKPGDFIPGLSISTRCQEPAGPFRSYTVTDSAGTSRVLMLQQAHGQQQFAVTEPRFSPRLAPKSNGYSPTML